MTPSEPLDVQAHAKERARKMVGRVQRRLRRQGTPPEVAGEILAVVDAALEHRSALVDDDHDHRLLHPARTVLVLMDDAGVVDPSSLRAGAALETRFPRFALPPARRVELGLADGPLLHLPAPKWNPGAAAGESNPGEGAAESNPAEEGAGEWNPGEGAGQEFADADAELLEELVSLDTPLLTVAVAEALDQVRHLHVEPGRPALRRGAVLVRDVYRPLAHRVDPDRKGLARRFDWWLRRVGRGPLEG